MGDSPHQITRREMLKRGAVIGGTVLWATPVVQTLGMGRAFAATPSDVCIGSCAVRVVDFAQGTTKDGNTITNPSRIDPTRALGPPGNGFYSLGYGGWMIMELGVAYYSGKNGEALVVETTVGAATYPLEKARVGVSDSPGGPWNWFADLATNKNPSPGYTKTMYNLDLLLGPNEVVRYVKLVDLTNDPDHIPSADGFDVDSVCVTCPAP